MEHQETKVIPYSKAIRVSYTGAPLVLPEAVQSGIDEHWNKILAEGKSFTRGEVFCITRMEETANALEVELALTDYAHFTAARLKHPSVAAHPCHVIYAAVLVESSDGHFVFGEMGAETASPGRLQCASGGLSWGDIAKDGTVDLPGSARRELFEETGLDAANPVVAEGFSKSFYLKTGGSRSHVAVIFILRVRLAAAEIEKIFQAHNAGLAAKGEAPELARLVYLPATPAAVEVFLKQNSSISMDDYMAHLLPLEARALERAAA